MPSIPNLFGAFLVGLSALTFSAAAQDGGSGSDGASAQADANNPLANVTALNFQNYYIDSFTQLPDDVDGNQFVIRYAKPLQFGETNWLLRASLPYNSFPVGSGFDTVSGIGDIDIFLAYQFPTQPGLSFGLGPQVVIPTASDDRLGADQWQLGIANVFFDGRSPKFQYGYLLIYRTGVGDPAPGRKNASLAAFQPFGFYQLGNGWYTGGAPIWTYDFTNDSYNMPLGLRTAGSSPQATEPPQTSSLNRSGPSPTTALASPISRSTQPSTSSSGKGPPDAGQRG